MGATDTSSLGCIVLEAGVGRLASYSSNGDSVFGFGAVATKLFSMFCLTATSLSAFGSTTTITDIQGSTWHSPLFGQTHSVTGVVTAKAKNGFWIVGEKSDDVRISNGLYIYANKAFEIVNAVAIGDSISVNGTVAEYRPFDNPNSLFLTELVDPTLPVVLSTGNPVTPVVLGRDRSPPTQYLSALDVGEDGFLAVPNNSSRIEEGNAALQPDKYGLDFWESLEGQLVTIPKPVALGFQLDGGFWVHGDWEVTGKNERGGLTLNFGPDGIPDGNPEAIRLGRPIAEGQKNPLPALGVQLTDITGVVTYTNGFYHVLPLEAPEVLSRPDPTVPPTTLTNEHGSLDDACTITFGDYNVENLTPTSGHRAKVAKHIVDYLKTPDILFLQEIQDDSGGKEDGVVTANLTLSNLVKEIVKQGGVTYSYASINPVNGKDGGEPGGNIRTAFLYRPEVLKLVKGVAGGSLDPVEVWGEPGHPKLNFNPVRIDPKNIAWNVTRKPLVAHWETKSGAELFTVNLHLSSKKGSSTQGDARPPVNAPIENRTKQVESVAGFIKDLLTVDPDANIIVAGDFNEFVQTRSVYQPLSGLLVDIDDAAGVPEYERYSYIFDQNSQQLDHAFISRVLERRRAEFEHIHVNTWSPSLAARKPDHDPAVGRVRLC